MQEEHYESVGHEESVLPEVVSMGNAKMEINEEADQLRVTEQGNSRTTQASGRSIIHPS